MTDPAASIAIPASTVALLRDVEGGVEVCMLRRTDRSSFAPGAFVFPGGAVDAADGAGDAAYAVAAVREVLEEVGILIGGSSDGTSDDDLRERTGAARLQLLAGGDFPATPPEHHPAIGPGPPAH